MEVRKAYHDINPTILYDEIKEFVQRQGITPEQSRLDTYSRPDDSSSFIYRGTITFKMQSKEALRAHILGSDKGETRLILDSDDALFPKEKIEALLDDLNFFLGSYESSPS